MQYFSPSTQTPTAARLRACCARALQGSWGATMLQGGHKWLGTHARSGAMLTCLPASQPLLLEAHVAAPRLAQQAADAEWWGQLHRHRPQPTAGEGETSGGCWSLPGQLGGPQGIIIPGRHCLQAAKPVSHLVG